MKYSYPGMERPADIEAARGVVASRSKRVESSCWEWTGSVVGGYGVMNRTRAHRMAYVAFVGPIPPGMVLDHLCRNTKCVNPDHLEAVPQRENILRGVGATAINARKTHCIHGHEFTPENTYAPPAVPGGRQCRACRTRRTAISNAKRKVR